MFQVPIDHFSGGEQLHCGGAQQGKVVCPMRWELEQAIPTFLQKPPCPAPKLVREGGGNGKL